MAIENNKSEIQQDTDEKSVAESADKPKDAK